MTEKLQAEGIVRRLGERTVVDGVDLSAAAGEVTAIIGPNGAGKTTLFHCLSGVEPLDAGRVLLDGVDVSALDSDARARRGLARTFQHSSVFPTLTVADNLRVAAENRRRRGIGRGLLGFADPDTVAVESRVRRALALLGLDRLADERAATLPTGTLRLVELARALCLEPSVLLLDEPASGLDQDETEELHLVVERLAADGLALVIVEHDMELVLGVADTLVALVAGRVVAAGDPATVAAHPEVRALVLGRPA